LALLRARKHERVFVMLPAELPYGLFSTLVGVRLRERETNRTIPNMDAG